MFKQRQTATDGNEMSNIRWIYQFNFERWRKTEELAELWRLESVSLVIKKVTDQPEKMAIKTLCVCTNTLTQ